jgi:predicted phosphate transport protein (TIGR00153 family)
MGSLIEFLKRETALNVLEKTIKHAQIVQECVKELEVGLKLLLKEKDVEQANKNFHKVDLLEDDADKLRRKIQREVSKGELNPSIRLNLSHLVKRLDDVANCSTGVARRIVTIPISFWEQSSEETLSIVLKIIETTVEAVEYLDKIVVDLVEKRKNVKEYAKLVEKRKNVKEYAKLINQYEHEVDLLNIKLRKSLQETDYKVNFFTIFTIGNIFDILEAISDSIEGVADYIMVLLTSTSGL